MKKSACAREEVSVNGAERQQSAPDNTGRDSHGRFVAGNGGGPGNPFARRVAQLRSVLLECVSDEDLRVIAGELVVQAKMGHLAAVKLLFQYVLGKPAATVDPDTLDQKEVEWFRAEPEDRVLTEVIGTRMPSELVARVCRGAVPAFGQAKADMLGDALLHPEDYLAAEDEDDEDDFEDDDEEAADHPEAAIGAVSARGAGATAAPSTNGKTEAAERPRATRRPQGPHANGRTTRQPGARTPMDPPESE